MFCATTSPSSVAGRPAWVQPVPPHAWGGARCCWSGWTDRATWTTRTSLPQIVRDWRLLRRIW